MSIRWSFLFAAFWLIGIFSPLFAACVQEDLAGTWKAYLAGSYYDGTWWNRCTLKVYAGGAIASGTICYDDYGNTGTVEGGKITLNSNCVATGSFNVDSAYDHLKSTITSATVDQAMTTMSGVGKDSMHNRFMINMVKQ